MSKNNFSPDEINVSTFDPQTTNPFEGFNVGFDSDEEQQKDELFGLGKKATQRKVDEEIRDGDQYAKDASLVAEGKLSVQGYVDNKPPKTVKQSAEKTAWAKQFLPNNRKGLVEALINAAQGRYERAGMLAEKGTGLQRILNSAKNIVSAVSPIDLPDGKLTSKVSQTPIQTRLAELNLRKEVSTRQLQSKPDPAFDLVRPFTGLMNAALTQIGIVPAKEIDVKTEQFYNNIVRKSQPENFAGGYELPEIYTALYRPTDNADAAVNAIITAVVQYVKNLKEQKEAGEQLSKVENTIASGAQKVEGEIETQAKEGAAKKVGMELLFSGKTPFYIGGALVLLVIAILFFRK